MLLDNINVHSDNKKSKKLNIIKSASFYNEMIRAIGGFINVDNIPLTHKVIKEKIFTYSDKIKINFLVEIRSMILSAYNITEDSESRNLLKMFHMYIHLALLYLKKGDFSKNLNEFLNINYKLDDEDFIKHTVRGNLGKLIEIKPELKNAIEAYMSNPSKDKTAIYEWTQNYKIPPSLKEIFLGKFKNFNNKLEMFCYYEMFNVKYFDGDHPGKMKFLSNSDPALDFMLNGCYQSLQFEHTNSLMLILSLVLPENNSMNSSIVMTLFEKTFIEVSNVSIEIANEFLFYSPSAQLFLSPIIQEFGFSHPNIYYIINKFFMFPNKPIYILREYYDYLNTHSDYETMRKLTLDYSKYLVDNDEECSIIYSKEFIDHLITSYDSYASDIQMEFLKNKNNRFAVIMALKEFTPRKISILMESDFFLYYLDVIVPEVIKLNDHSILLKILDVIYLKDNKDAEMAEYLHKHKILILEHMEKN